MLSWVKQEAEARAGGGPLVSALAAARGLDEQELIRRILAKAEAFAVLSGTIIGQRQPLEDQVRADSINVGIANGQLMVNNRLGWEVPVKIFIPVPEV